MTGAPSSLSMTGALFSLHDHMRWQAAVHSPLFSLPSKTTPHPRRPLSSLSRDLSLSDQISSILSTLPPSTPIEPHLDLLSPLLSPHSISLALDSSPPPSLPLSFRLFVWASRHRHLRSWLSHNLIISALRQSPSGFDSAWDSLLQLKNSRIPISPAVFSVLISAYAASGLAEKAVDAFARMPEFSCRPNTFVYNTILQLLIDKDVILLAMAVYNQMLKTDCRPNRATYGILIGGLCKVGMSADALRLLDDMVQRGIKANTKIYTVFLSSLCRAGRMADAMRLLESMREIECRPDSATYNVLLSGFCKVGRMDEAFENLRAFREESFELGLNGYSCLIEGLFRAGRFEEACRYYREMLEKNVKLDCVLYNILIKGYLDAGRIEDAFSFLGEMTGRGITPNTFSYNLLIKGLCDAGLLDRARSLRLEISEHDLFPDSATYTIMICGLCKEGLIDEAHQIFDEMGKLGCLPTVVTFNSLINGLCKAGDVEEALILFYNMEVGRRPSLFLRLSQGANQVGNRNSLCKLVEDLCQSGLVVKAYKLLRDIIDSGVLPNIVTYNTLIDGFCRAGDTDGALKLFKELLLRGHSPDTITYGTLLNGLTKVHRDEAALSVFQHMLRSGLSPSLSILNTLMRTLCRKKRLSQAVTLWLNHISKENSSPEQAETIRTARGKFEQGYLEEAVKGLVELDQKRGSVNSSPYTIWLIGLCQERRIDEALKIFTILREFDVEATPASCVLLINYLCWQRKLNLALDVMLYAVRKGFSFMKPVGNRLITRLCTHNMKEDAHELARRMSLTGYDMDSYLHKTTKELLYGH